ncbi:MAG: type II secretion system F family protein [Candidatus Methylomirabilia bacterium]
MTGQIEAPDSGAVSARLQELGFFPLNVRAVAESETASGRLRFARGGGRRLAEFSRQLAVLLEAGIPLDHALGIAGEVADDPGFRDVIARVRRSVEEGTSLADALARHPRVFDELYVSMVRAGEAGGALDQILKRLAEFLEEWQRIRDVVVSALLYPLFLSVFAAAAVTVLMVFVVPRFAEVFGDMGARLPAPTRVLMAVSEFLRRFWWLLAAGVAAAAAALALGARTPRWRTWWDRHVLGLPLAGDLAVKIQVSRFARVFGTLIASGVPILRALEIVTGTLTNSVFSNSLANVQTGLKEGQGVAEPLRRAGVFPPLFLHMVAVGEETGRLEEMMLTVAASFDRDVETAARRLLSLIEPIIILIMGLVIGAIILSILWAIFSVNQLAF